jgi:tetratricopeptide (TPR) repeat protein
LNARSRFAVAARGLAFACCAIALALAARPAFAAPAPATAKPPAKSAPAKSTPAKSSPAKATPAKAAPAKPAPEKPAAPAADTLAGRYASEEAMRLYLDARLLEQSGKLSEALDQYYRALSLDPRSADLLVRISQILAQTGEPSRSLEFAERALARDPNDWRALWLQGAARFSTGHTSEALAPLERACEIDSTQVEVLRTTARVAESLGRTAVAEQAWRRLVWADDDDGEAWFQVAAAQARRGDFKGAEFSLGRAVDLNPTRPGLMFLQGWVKENLGDEAGAIELYQRHLDAHADDLGTRRRLVGLYARLGRFSEAYEQAKRVGAAVPDDPEAMQIEADLAMKLKKNAEADRVITELRALNPGEPDNTARAVVVLARNGRGRDAGRIADEWMRAHPANDAGPMLATRAWSAAGFPDSALARARRAVALSPDSTEPRRMLARALQGAGRYGEAEHEWLALRAATPEEPGVSLELGGCRERAGNIDGAVSAGRDALKIAPDWPPALNFVGYVLADHDRELPEARKLIERALEKDPENGAYIDSYGWVLYRQGDLAGARERLERAVKLTDGDPVVREHLGDVYRDLKLPDLAREQYKLSVASDGENAKRVGDKLKALR